MLVCRTFYAPEELPQTDWNAVVQDDYFMSYEYLLHLSESMSDTFSYRYILAYEEEMPLAAAAIFTMNLDMGMLLENKTLRGMVSGLRKLVKTAFYAKTMVVGAPPSIGNKTIVISQACPDKNAVMDLLINAINALAESERTKLSLYKEVGRSFLHDFETCISNHGFIIGTSLPNNILDVRWESFEAYSGAMKAKYRSSINASLKKIADSNIEMVFDDQLCKNYTAGAYGLYLDVVNKSETVFEVLSREYFQYSGNVPQISPGLISMYCGDRLVGYFFVADLSAAELGVLFAGIDYKYRHQYDTYFNLIYASIKLAITRGKTKISFGQNSYELKKRIGCIPEELFVLYKHKNRFVNYILKRLNKFLFPVVEIEPKSIFKGE